MTKQYAFNTEKTQKDFTELFSTPNFLVRLFSFNAFADDGGESENNDEGGASNTNTPTVNYEDLISKARKDEKDKLYPKIKSLEDKIKALTESSNAHLITIGEKDVEIGKLKKQIEANGTEDPEVVKTLRKDLLEAEKARDKAVQELEAVKESTPDAEAIKEEVKKEYEVKLHRETLLVKNKDSIIPELLTGTTVEELDTSLVTAKARFDEIVKAVGGTVSDVPSTNVGNGTTSRASDLNADDIANMDPRSPEYAEFRKSLGLR